MADEKEPIVDETEESSGSGFTFNPKIGIPILLVQLVAAYFLASYVVVPTFFPAAQAGESLEEEPVDDGSFGAVYMVEDVIVNPAESGGSRYVVVNVAFEVKDSGDTDMLELKDPKLRDMLIRNLGSRTIEQLDGPDDKEMLRQEIMNSVSTLLPKGHLKNVYFVNYILQ